MKTLIMIARGEENWYTAEHCRREAEIIWNYTNRHTDESETAARRALAVIRSSLDDLAELDVFENEDEEEMDDDDDVWIEPNLLDCMALEASKFPGSISIDFGSPNTGTASLDGPTVGRSNVDNFRICNGPTANILRLKRQQIQGTPTVKEPEPETGDTATPSTRAREVKDTSQRREGSAGQVGQDVNDVASAEVVLPWSL
jgi:hypothetical protein